jgi:hypothetical protein
MDVDDDSNKIKENGNNLNSQNDSSPKDNKENKKTQLQQEFLKFLNSHTVYEALPENIKVTITKN